MTQDVSEKQPGTSASSVLETATRICLCVVGVLYAIGFAVQTLHLARYGIADTSILKAEYVLTGILVCVPIAIPGAVLVAVSMLWHLWFMKQPDADVVRRVWYVNRLLVFASVLLFFSGIYRFAIHFKSALQFVEYFGLCWDNFGVHFTATLLLNAIAHWYGEWRYRGKIYRAPKMLVAGALSVVGMMFVAAFAAYITSFVDTVHSKIPTGFGGAQPLEIQFFFDPLARPHFLAEESPELSKPMLLYGQSDSCYLISIRNDGEDQRRFMQLRKDQILGMRVKPAEY